MERIVLYAIAVVNLIVGVKLSLDKKSPYGRGTYEEFINKHTENEKRGM